MDVNPATGVARRRLTVLCLLLGPMGAVAVGGEGTTTADPRIRIVAPADNTTVNPGQALLVTVELTPPLTASNTVGVTLVGYGRLATHWVRDLMFEVTTPPLPPVTGTLTLVPDLIDSQGQVVTGAPVTLVMAAPSAPVSITLQQPTFHLRPGSLPRQLHVDGRLANGMQVDLRSGRSGTRYTSSDPEVVTVDADGRVSIVGAGVATVAVQHGALSTAATFVVRDPAKPSPATHLTAQFQITRGDFVHDRNTGVHRQQVSVRNTSNRPAPVPLTLVLSGLPAGVTLANRSGVTGQLAPAGRPYIVMRPAGDGLTMAPGATLTYAFEFRNPARVDITYTLDVVGGTDEP